MGSATICSSPRSLSQRQRRPVRGLNSCSCQPSPKPISGRVAEASNCSIATLAPAVAVTVTAS